MTNLVWYDTSNDMEADRNRNRARDGAHRYLYVNSQGVPGIVRIVRTPDTCAGHPRIDGTRMTIHDLVCMVQVYIEKGATRHEAIEHVGLDFPDYPPHIILAIMQWYEWSDGHKREIDRILKERREWFKRMAVLQKEKKPIVAEPPQGGGSKLKWVSPVCALLGLTVCMVGFASHSMWLIGFGSFVGTAAWTKIVDLRRAQRKAKSDVER